MDVTTGRWAETVYYVITEGGDILGGMVAGGVEVSFDVGGGGTSVSSLGVFGVSASPSLSISLPLSLSLSLSLSLLSPPPPFS